MGKVREGAVFFLWRERCGKRKGGSAFRRTQLQEGESVAYGCGVTVFADVLHCACVAEARRSHIPSTYIPFHGTTTSQTENVGMLLGTATTICLSHSQCIQQYLNFSPKCISY
ncbi:hypothetical protein E2C01_062498 [Portunus trituberculatus]|uniref:Uncharacterized protein n=1 Tax=Portunus trituberculatus TaxID=210409 RepID=A0A5B7HEU9_PORTR|nr:hypothetical protein [Portunus trituberculatus]